MNGGLDICVYDNSGARVGQPGCQCRPGYSGKYCQTGSSQSMQTGPTSQVDQPHSLPAVRWLFFVIMCYLCTICRLFLINLLSFYFFLFHWFQFSLWNTSHATLLKGPSRNRASITRGATHSWSEESSTHQFWLCATPYSGLKGTVARDFWPLVFFMNRPHMGP